jgi:tetratricopeptide (TPR) repeat protein
VSIVALAFTGLGHAESNTTTAERVDPRPASAFGNPVEDGDRALAAGRFDQALSLYERAIDNGSIERHAFREAGRAAHALRKFDLAIRYLTRADEMSSNPDPELLFLLGEAHWETNNTIVAKAIHERALAAIGTPRDRSEKLWTARIRARFGQRAAADAIYDELVAASPRDSEAALAQAEMHAAARDWNTAERVVRRLLRDVPEHPRALAMLAWFLEAQGRLAAELELRATIAANAGHARDLRDYGRALERAGDWASAREAYRKATALPDGASDAELARAFARVDQRMSVEVAAGVIGRTDPAASSLGGFAGIALPFGRASQASLLAAHEYATIDGGEGFASDVRASAILRRGDAAFAGGLEACVVRVRPGDASTMPQLDRFVAGAFVSATSGLLAEHVTLTLDGELHTRWRETPGTLFEGGRTSGMTGHVFFTGLGRRLVIDTGAQARQLELAAEMGRPTAEQLLVWGGADYIAWADFTREARGQILDDELLHPTFAADSAVIGYRHYELFGASDAAFGRRLSLAERASIDELSVTLHKIFADGALAIEGRGGFGRDWARDLYLSRGGLAVWISPTPRSRLSLSFDLARESVRALAGERRTGWMNYHVDL